MKIFPTLIILLCVVGVFDCSFAESPKIIPSNVPGYVNISDQAEGLIQVSLVIGNRGEGIIRLPTKRDGGADNVVQKRVENGVLYLVNLWGTEYALAGSNGAVAVKQPAGKLGEVELQPGEFTRLEPISLDLKWAKKNGVRKVIYEYVSNPNNDSPNDLWSGKVKVEFELDEMYLRLKLK